MGTAVCGSIVYPIRAVEEEPKTIVSDLENSVKTQSETKKETVPMWKAVLSEYGGSLSLVDYETVEVEEEVTTEAEEPEDELIADSEGEYDDTSYIESSRGAGIVDVPERPGI